MVKFIFKNNYPALALYCDQHSLNYPEVVLGKPETDGAVAACHPTEWKVILNELFYKAKGLVTEKTMGHELAHLIVRVFDRMDSITHGPKFVAKEFEIEKFCTYERRKALRDKKNHV